MSRIADRIMAANLALDRASVAALRHREARKLALTKADEGFPPEDCQGCGEPTNGGEGGYCPECAAGQAGDRS